MPNWAYTDYVCESIHKEDIQDLYRRMKALEERKDSLIDNGFGQNWIGNLVADLGGDVNSIRCRGEWFCSDLYGDTLRFETESAWAELDEFRHFIESKYKDMKIYYISEECGMGVYISNDITHKYFDTKYKLGIEDVELDDENFTSLDQIRGVLRDTILPNLTDEEDIFQAIDNWSDETGRWVSIETFSYIDD